MPEHSLPTPEVGKLKDGEEIPAKLENGVLYRFGGKSGFQENQDFSVCPNRFSRMRIMHARPGDQIRRGIRSFGK